MNVRGWLLGMAALPLAASSAPQVFDLDPAQTFVHFEVLHFDTSTLRGRVGPVRGEVMLDADAGRGRLGLVIDMRTLDTGFRLLDARLRQRDLFDVDDHPEAWFVAERFRFEQGQPVEVTGEFTLRGVSAPLTLRALRFGCVEATGTATSALWRRFRRPGAAQPLRRQLRPAAGGRPRAPAGAGRRAAATLTPN